MKQIEKALQWFKNQKSSIKVIVLITIIIIIMGISITIVNHNVNRDKIEKDKIIYNQQIKEKEKKEEAAIKKDEEERKLKRKREIAELKAKNNQLEELENKSKLFKDTFLTVDVGSDTFEEVKVKLIKQGYEFTEDKSTLDSDGFSKIEVKSKENNDKVVISFSYNTSKKTPIEKVTTYMYYQDGTNKSISADNGMFTSDVKYNLEYNEKSYLKDVGYDTKVNPIVENGSVIVYLESNLPDDIEVTVRLKSDTLDYSSQDTRVVKNGKAMFGQYSNRHMQLSKGTYDIIVEVDRVDHQANELKKKISKWVCPGLNEYGDIRYNIKSISI